MPRKTVIYIRLSLLLTLAGAYQTNPALSQTVVKGGSRNKAIEEGLVALAQPVRANIFIDSTNPVDIIIPEPQDPSTRGPANNIVGGLVSYAQSYHLSTGQMSASTFLFWPEPNAKEIAESVGRGEGFGDEEGTLPMAIFGKQLLSEFYPDQDKTVRDGNDTTTDDTEHKITPKQLKLSDLSLGLQKQVAAYLLNTRYIHGTRTFAELCFSNNVWSKARVVYSPGSGHTDSVPSLSVQYIIREGATPSIVAVDAFTGGIYAEPIRPITATSVQPPQQGTLQIFSTDRSPDGKTLLDAKPIIVSETTRATGTALSKLQLQTEQGLNDPLLSGLVSVEAIHEKLELVLAKAKKGTNVDLELSPQIKNQNLLISLCVQDMPLVEFMKSTARLYNCVWIKTNANTFVLRARDSSVIDHKLSQVGYFPYYRFREMNVPAWEKRKSDFNSFAASLVDEAGPDVLKAPGVPVASLSEDIQQELKTRTEQFVARNLVLDQLSRYEMLDKEWVLQVAPIGIPSKQTTSQFTSPFRLMLLLDGQMRGAISIPALRRDNN